jgi:hypothetical protein
MNAIKTANDVVAAWNVVGNAVGAMDVRGKRSAAEFGANVIARSVDHAKTLQPTR